MLYSNMDAGILIFMKAYYIFLSDKFMVGLTLFDLRGIYDGLGGAVEDTG